MVQVKSLGEKEVSEFWEREVEKECDFNEEECKRSNFDKVAGV